MGVKPCLLNSAGRKCFMVQGISSTIFRKAATDKAEEGFCARGVFNILTALGIPCTSGDAHTWKTTLPQNGWKLVHGRPEDAPVGAVLVFDRNKNYMNLPEKDRSGRRFGHVEVVAERDGQRMYVSDEPRENWGGSVRGNFVGYYVHPDLGNMTNGDKPERKIIEAVASNAHSNAPEGARRSPRKPETLSAAFNFDAGALENMNFGQILMLIFEKLLGIDMTKLIRNKPGELDGPVVDISKGADRAVPATEQAPGTELPATLKT